MSNYITNNELFSYTIVNNSSSYELTIEDYNIIASAFGKWDDIVTKNERFTNGYTINVNFSVETLGYGILGGAQVLTLHYFDNYDFGNSYTDSGIIKLNETYMNSLRNTIHTDNKTTLYNVILHEIGHILGIGSFWHMSGAPITAYSEYGITKYYYTGTNALREYKSYIPSISNTIVGVPIEDNGGSGTQNVHPEEGDEGIISSNSRYINGYFHPGLDNEIMSCWMENQTKNAALSRISLGFLEDMGFIVDYTKVDNYEIILNQNYINTI